MLYASSSVVLSIQSDLSYNNTMIWASSEPDLLFLRSQLLKLAELHNQIITVGELLGTSFHEGECMKWCKDLSGPLDLTLARTKGSLAVALSPVIAVYGLDLVEASPTIYVIHPVCVARVDKVVARPG